MRFSVDAWDVGYGTALAVAEEDLPASVARVETDIETPAGQWAPVPVAAACRIRPRSCSSTGSPYRRPRLDRRPTLRRNIDDAPPAGGIAATALMAVCASYAAGVVCCCGPPGRRQAHLLAAEIRRGLFTTAAHATDIQTRAGTYRARHTVGSDTVPLTMTLSNALQQALAEIEVITALAARTALPGAAEHAGSHHRTEPTTCSSSTGRCATGRTCPAPWGSSRRTEPGTCHQT